MRSIIVTTGIISMLTIGCTGLALFTNSDIDVISTGGYNRNCYITTPFMPSDDLVVHMRFTVPKFENNDVALFGTKWTRNYFCALQVFDGGKGFLKWHAKNAHFSFPITSGTELDAHFASDYIMVNGIKHQMTGRANYEEDSWIRFFATVEDCDRVRSAYADVRLIEILRGGTPVFRATPRLHEGELGFYDSIGQKFYPSEGKDAFSKPPLS